MSAATLLLDHACTDRQTINERREESLASGKRPVGGDILVT